MTSLYAQIDGEMVALDNCKWVRFAPNGCAYSSTTGDTATTEDDAHRFFVPRQRDRERETRKGWTVRLLNDQQWSKQAAPCFYGKCTHGGAA